MEQPPPKKSPPLKFKVSKFQLPPQPPNLRGGGGCILCPGPDERLTLAGNQQKELTKANA